MTNEDSTTPYRRPAHGPPPVPAAGSPMRLVPLEKGPSFLSTFEAVLRRPGSVLHHVTNEPPGKLIWLLLACAATCLLVFGLVVGTFSMGDNLWSSPLKIVGGLFFAGLICLPSLYIFSCLSDLEIRIATVTGMLAAVICLASLLLVGFAPVVWIFSQSTDSVAFVGGLNLVIWIIAAWFGLALLKNCAIALGSRHTGHLKVWMAIFLLVTFQMTTALRPIVDKHDHFFPSEKKFFLAHWFDTMGAGNTD